MWDGIRKELEIIWAAHSKLGLQGKMRVFTIVDIEPWRAQERGFEFWFGMGEIDAAIEQIKANYNDGKLPNSPLLLDPVVYDDAKQALGSAVFWSTSMCLGIAKMAGTEAERVKSVGAYCAPLVRGEEDSAGLKAVGFSERILHPLPEGGVEGCRELYELIDIESELYHNYYILSGMEYLSKNGSFLQADFAQLGVDEAPQLASPENVKEAATCWNAYDRHHRLYERFGIDEANLERNLKYFNLCARNFEFFDATGPQREGADDVFDFVVEGMIPRGAVTVLAGAGGTGKSSIAHHLCVLAGIEYEADEPKPMWLGQTVNVDKTQGICVYFSGEDGPAVINARADLFDPQGRANRVMFQRAQFRDNDETLPQFMKRLGDMPDVPIMVIDPARKYLEGDENDSEIVSEFFEAIEEFAIRKNCAMIVVHHLEKSAKPQSCREILDLLRGSQVFIDRPRVVLGLYRDGPYTVVGLAKCNIPPNMGMITEERVFARDPKTLRLIQLPGEAGVRNAGLTEEELEEIKTRAELEEAKRNI